MGSLIHLGIFFDKFHLRLVVAYLLVSFKIIINSCRSSIIWYRYFGIEYLFRNILST